MSSVFLKNINSLVAFLLELCLLTALAYCGFHLSFNKPVQIGLALALPVLAIMLWGRFAAPKAQKRLRYPYLSLFKFLLFAISVVLLFMVGKHRLGIALAIVFVVNEWLNIRFEYKQ